jgi:hypothetical protein
MQDDSWVGNVKLAETGNVRDVDGGVVAGCDDDGVVRAGAEELAGSETLNVYGPPVLAIGPALQTHVLGAG